MKLNMNKKMNISNISVLIVLCVFTYKASAYQDNSNLNVDGGWVFGGLLTEGGDTLTEIEVTNIFDNTDTEKLKGGGFMYLYGGYSWFFNSDQKDRNSVQLTFGYHSDFIVGGDDSVSFDRFPLDLIGYQHKDQWRIGTGITYQFSPTLDLDDIDAGKYDFDEALGFMIELGYELTPNQYLILRLTEIDYEINGTDLSGSNVGIGFSGVF